VVRRRRVIFIVAIATVAVLGWIGFRIVYTFQQTSDAYAAWDTGTLLVEYMRTHEDRWPASWDELLSVLESESGHQILLRGAQAGDIQYVRSLREKIAVDWSFDPDRASQRNPVTRLDGTALPVTWEGAEPNEMVREYLKVRVATRPTGLR